MDKSEIKFTDHGVRKAIEMSVAGFPPFFINFVGVAFTRISARAIGSYMRNATSERTATGNYRGRSPSDTGPLRILSGRLARSLQNAEGSHGREGVKKVTATRHGAKGILGSRVPYAGVHERGASFSLVAQRRTINTPARPYLAPAMRKEQGWVDKELQREFHAYLMRFFSPQAISSFRG